ncbi:hypothetical protein C8A05DRAFT_34998, partial [Staphylotrichum tortipilum]
NEFEVLLGYLPNLWRLVENGTSVGVMRGVRCKDAFFARAVEEQARILGCPKMLVPGHHQGFEVETEEFLPCLLEMLETLEKKRAARVTFLQGSRLTARRSSLDPPSIPSWPPPPPFHGQYYRVPADPFRDFLNKARFPSRAKLREMKQVDYCLSVASRALPCRYLGETAVLKVAGELAVGDRCAHGSGAQYPFADDDFPHIPNDVVVRAENDFALESAAYSYLDGEFSGKLIPKFHGSWIVNIPLKDLERPVGFILMEHIDSVPLNKHSPQPC